MQHVQNWVHGARTSAPALAHFAPPYQNTQVSILFDQVVHAFGDDAIILGEWRAVYIQGKCVDDAAWRGIANNGVFEIGVGPTNTFNRVSNSICERWVVGALLVNLFV